MGLRIRILWCTRSCVGNVRYMHLRKCSYCNPAPARRAARPPSGHGCCRNPVGHPQRHNPFRVSAGRCAPAALGSSGASDARLHTATLAGPAATLDPCRRNCGAPALARRPPAKLFARRAQFLALHTLAACRSGQFDCACPTRLALASWARPSFSGTRVLAAPPVLPSALAQTLLAVAECEAHDARRDISAADRASAAAFSAMPDAGLASLDAVDLQDTLH